MTLLIFLVGGATTASAQQPAAQSQEISDVDGRPVLIKHLPDLGAAEQGLIFGTEKAALENAVPNQPVLHRLEFPFGTEYVTAVYPQGRVLIIEYTNPQSSSEADARIQEFAGTQPDAGFIYRRIGNYNTFVFGAVDPAAANGLLDQIKYEKTVQWLGEDPYILKKLERYMVTTSRDVMISTVLVIVGGIVSSVLAGILVGFVFFRFRDQKRASRTAFSDAGGLTRLNLDGLSE
ncbi:MAG TPA: hypothetical protein VMZ26_10230 [Pyrinomonadaceae bacterium]|nr:hypothetical protein [Pyrinomonadaceae bacterium]